MARCKWQRRQRHLRRYARGPPPSGRICSVGNSRGQQVATQSWLQQYARRVLYKKKKKLTFATPAVRIMLPISSAWLPRLARGRIRQQQAASFLIVLGRQFWQQQQARGAVLLCSTLRPVGCPTEVYHSEYSKRARSGRCNVVTAPYQPTHPRPAAEHMSRVLLLVTVALAWRGGALAQRPGPGSGDPTCSTGEEGVTLDLSCPATAVSETSVITDVKFALYGSVSGTCQSALGKGDCGAEATNKGQREG
eukprot:COSAG01_NODE_14130_length_1493_cov_0.829986_1_plen_249_part_10